MATIQAAIAAVGAFDPRFLGYAMQLPGRIGEGPHVTGAAVPDGWELTFVTGSGDCMAGCIDHAYSRFHVSRSGTVTPLCQWSTEADRVVQGTPC